MSVELADWDKMTGEQRYRWTTILGHLTAAIPPGAPSVILDGTDRRAALLADRPASGKKLPGPPAVSQEHRFPAAS